MDETLQSAVITRLRDIKLPDPSELELRFLTGVADLNMFTGDPAPALPTPEELNELLTVVKFVRRFSNLPNMLKKREALVRLFTPNVQRHAETAVLATPYLGIDPSARNYFIPVEFRTYWALVLGLTSSGKNEVTSLVGALNKKKLIVNRAEFEEMIERIGR